MNEFENVRLSIIVPVYNMMPEGKLEFCLRSLLNQTLPSYEIIAVDDASTDDSLTYMKELEKKHPEKLRVFTTDKNLHQGGAKNLGIKKARGEWIGFVDADDFVSPDMFKKLLDKAGETGADCVCCTYSLVHSHSFEIGAVEINNTPDQLGVLDDEKYKKIILNPGSMVIKIYKRGTVTENKLFFPEHVFYEDNCMASLWLLYAKRLEQVDEPLYYYYQNDVSTVHTVTLERCADRLTVMDMFVSEMKTRGFYETYKNETEFKFTQLYLVNTLFSLLYGEVKKSFPMIKRMRLRMKELFPDFEDNAYYKELIHPEEKKLVHFLMISPVFFMCYFKLLRAYRRLRYGK